MRQRHGVPATALFLTLLLTVLLAQPSWAYTVYLKDGSRLVAAEKPVIEGDQAIIVLQSGTRTSIAASEIDVARTQEANKDDYGTALVLEDGSFTEINEDRIGAGQGKLSAAASGTRLGDRPRARREVNFTSGDELENWQRVPYRGNLEVSSEILGVFRGQGIEQVGVYQGTAPGRLLIELPANSESAVFRGLKISAGALARVAGLYPDDVSAFELVLSTAQRERAGQFLINAEEAAILLADDIELSTYFVDRVRF